MIKYEKTITLNDDSIKVVTRSLCVLLAFIEEKCINDNERLEFFRIKLTNSQRVFNAKDIIIEWSVSTIVGT